MHGALRLIWSTKPTRLRLVLSVALLVLGSIFPTAQVMAIASLSLTKIANPDTYDAVGDIIAYTYTITNTGSVTLNSSFTVSDDKAMVACTQSDDGALSPNESMTCNATYIITQADLDTGFVTNIATASGGGATSNTAIATAYAVQMRALSLTKVADPSTYDAVGDIITYTYTIVNTGNVTLNASTQTQVNPLEDATIVLGEELAHNGADLAITSQQSPGGSCNTTRIAFLKFDLSALSGDAQIVSAALRLRSTFASNASLTMGLYAVDDDSWEETTVTWGTRPALGAGPLSTANLAPIGSDLVFPSTSSLIALLEAERQTDHDQIVSLALAPLTCSGFSATQATSSREGAIAPALELTTYTPSGGGPFSVSDDKATVACTQPDDGALSPGETMACSASYTIIQADLDAGAVTNTATASGDGVASNPASATVTASQTPHLSLSKAADPGNYSQVGDIIHYTLTASNDGNVTLNSVAISDPLLPALTCTPDQPATLAPGDALVCTGDYTITQADLDAGAVTNTAAASGNGPSGPVSSLPATETVVAAQNRALSLTKEAAPTSYDEVGDVIAYTYTIANSGNVTLNGPFDVSDDKATVVCTQPDDGALSPNETMTCSASYTITQADLDAGAVTNTATATGGGVTSNTASATVTAVCFGDIDGDHDRDIVDIQICAGHWNSRSGDPNYDARCDVDSDGDIDIVDLQRIAAVWNRPCPGGRITGAMSSGQCQTADAADLTPAKQALAFAVARDVLRFRLP